LLGLAQSISWLIGYFVWGRVVDRFGALRCTMFTFMILAVAPVTYAFATSGWMLLPAFISIGLVSAGADIGLTNSCLELSDPDHTQEYAAAQSTVIGLRGFVAPFLGVAQPSGVLALVAAFFVGRVQKM
jgi:MFS family permease